MCKGLDFGLASRVQLPPLTYLERMALSRARPYVIVFQISGANAGRGQQAKFRGHTIVFGQEEAPTTVMEKLTSLPRKDVHTFLKLCL